MHDYRCLKNDVIGYTENQMKLSCPLHGVQKIETNNFSSELQNIMLCLNYFVSQSLFSYDISILHMIMAL